MPSYSPGTRYIPFKKINTKGDYTFSLESIKPSLYWVTWHGEDGEQARVS